MRRAATGIVAALLAGLGMLGTAGPARAECVYIAIPPATEAAASAREVIVGQVVENVDDQLFDFRLRIDHVLRGPAEVGDLRRFEMLYPGWPMTQLGDGTTTAPCEAIPGWKDNVIALSLGALAPDGKTRYNAASWISGDLEVVYRDLPRTSLAEMIRLAALPSTDVGRTEVPADSQAPLFVLPVLAAVAALFAVATRRSVPKLR